MTTVIDFAARPIPANAVRAAGHVGVMVYVSPSRPGRLDVRPGNAGHDRAHRSRVHPERGGNIALEMPSAAEPSNFQNLPLGKDGRLISGASTLARTGDLIVGVVLMSADNQVFGVHARRVVADVAYDKTGRDRAVVRKLPRHHMRSVVDPSEFELPVSVGKSGPLPHPASKRITVGRKEEFESIGDTRAYRWTGPPALPAEGIAVAQDSAVMQLADPAGHKRAIATVDGTDTLTHVEPLTQVWPQPRTVRAVAGLIDSIEGWCS